MRKYGLFLIILVLINLISAFTFSPSQQTGVRVAVLNESQEGTPGSTSGGGGGGGSSDKFELEGLSEKELCRSSWECDKWNECESFQRSTKVNSSKRKDKVIFIKISFATFINNFS